jgi:hypothetical protein
MINSILFLFLLTAPVLQPTAKNDHVKLELSVQATVSEKTAATVSFMFTPLEGIHVNTLPNIEFKLEKDSPFELIGKPTFVKTEKDYLDVTQPVIVTVKAKKNSVKGRAVIKGKLNYFFCSDKDGWCNRFSQPIEIGIEITK